MKEEEEMAQIEIKLEKQLLTIQNREVISSGDVNYDSCRFEFDESWEGYIKTAVFYQEKQTGSSWRTYIESREKRRIEAVHLWIGRAHTERVMRRLCT